MLRHVSPEKVKQYFRGQGKLVLTFVGYSESGYEDIQTMLEKAQTVLTTYDPEKTIVNIGATSSGIGAVYELAQRMGFPTTGIVSTLALEYHVKISPYADNVFFVEDNSWGGFMKNTQELSPVSQTLVQCSDKILGIGGGQVGCDEMIVAKQQGKSVLYIPADMNHQVAIDKARRKGIPAPVDFMGAAFRAFGE